MADSTIHGLTALTGANVVPASDELAIWDDDAAITKRITINEVKTAIGLPAAGVYAVGDILYASSTSVLARLADVAVGSVLVSGGVTTAPAWSAAPSLTTSLTVPFINLSSGFRGTPYTLPQITMYTDGTNWAGINYGDDTILRIIYGKNAAGALHIGQSTAIDGTGVFTPNLVVHPSGNVGIVVGSASIGSAGVDRGTTVGTKALHIFDGTAPAGTLANGCSIYSASGELWAMDAAGNGYCLTAPYIGGKDFLVNQVFS